MRGPVLVRGHKGRVLVMVLVVRGHVLVRDRPRTGQGTRGEWSRTGQGSHMDRVLVRGLVVRGHILVRGLIWIEYWSGASLRRVAYWSGVSYIIYIRMYVYNIRLVSIRRQFDTYVHIHTHTMYP